MPALVCLNEAGIAYDQGRQRQPDGRFQHHMSRSAILWWSKAPKPLGRASAMVALHRWWSGMRLWCVDMSASSCPRPSAHTDAQWPKQSTKGAITMKGFVDDIEKLSPSGACKAQRCLRRCCRGRWRGCVDLSGFDAHAHFANGIAEWVFAVFAFRSGRYPTRSHRIAPSLATDRSSITRNGVLDLNRVTIRQPAASSVAQALK